MFISDSGVVYNIWHPPSFNNTDKCILEIFFIISACALLEGVRIGCFGHSWTELTPEVLLKGLKVVLKTTEYFDPQLIIGSSYYLVTSHPMWSQPPWSNSPWVYFSYGFVSNATLNGLLMPFSPFSLASPFSSLSSSLSNASHHHGSGIKRSVHMAVATGWALSKLPMCIQPLQRLAMRPLDFCRFSLFEVCIYLATSRFTSLCFWHLVQCKYSFPRPEQVRCSCFALVRSACFATIARVCFVHQLTDPKNLFYHTGVICGPMSRLAWRSLRRLLQRSAPFWMR